MSVKFGDLSLLVPSVDFAVSLSIVWAIGSATVVPFSNFISGVYSTTFPAATFSLPPPNDVSVLASHFGDMIAATSSLAVCPMLLVVASSPVVTKLTIEFTVVLWIPSSSGFRSSMILRANVLSNMIPTPLFEL